MVGVGHARAFPRGVQPRHAYRFDTRAECTHGVWCNVLWVVGGAERNRRWIKNTGEAAAASGGGDGVADADAGARIVRVRSLEKSIRDTGRGTRGKKTVARSGDE